MAVQSNYIVYAANINTFTGTPYYMPSWLRCTVVECRSLTGELSLSHARSVADGWPLMWVTGQTSAIDKPTRPTQPFILSGSIYWVVSWSICVPLFHTKFHLHRCIVSPLREPKKQIWYSSPQTKLNASVQLKSQHSQECKNSRRQCFLCLTTLTFWPQNKCFHSRTHDGTFLHQVGWS